MNLSQSLKITTTQSIDKLIQLEICRVYCFNFKKKYLFVSTSSVNTVFSAIVNHSFQGHLRFL